MIIPNLQFEEITKKEKQIKNKNSIREKLLSDQAENLNIKEYNSTLLIELLPNNVTFSSQQVLSDLLNQNLTDQQLSSILKTLVQWDNQKSVDLSNLYKQLFNQSICKSTLSEALVFCKEDLVIIMNQLKHVYQISIVDDPQKLQNISQWIHVIIENNKLSIPIKETQKLLDLIKQNQKFQESIRNIKLLMDFAPKQQKQENRITHVYF